VDNDVKTASDVEEQVESTDQPIKENAISLNLEPRPLRSFQIITDFHHSDSEQGFI
jgi:hypothetical protein